MKTLTFLLAVILSVAASAQEAVFVKATRELDWPDGSYTAVGTVELVLSQNEQAYIIAGLKGLRLTMPKDAAVVVSAEEAALALLREREKIAALVTAQEARAAQAPAQTSAQRYYERKVARDAKARADAAAAAQFQQQEALQGINRELRDIRKEIGR